jgi:hypothetical protein
MGIDPPDGLSAMRCRIAQQGERFFLRSVILHVLSALCGRSAGKRGFKNPAQDFACGVLVVEIASIRESDVARCDPPSRGPARRVCVDPS